MTTDSSDGTYPIGGKKLTSFVDNYRLATEFLRLGMYELSPETIAVSSAGVTDESEVRFQGAALGGGSIRGSAKSVGGLISQIHIEIDDPASKIRGRIIDVVHQSGALKKIIVSAVRPHGTVPYSSYEVLRLIMPRDSLPASSCDVENFMVETDGRILTKETGEAFFYSRTGSGTNARLTLKPVPQVVVRPPYFKYLVWVILALAIMAPLYGFIRRKN
jgi:hypothetical protein